MPARLTNTPCPEASAEPLCEELRHMLTTSTPVVVEWLTAQVRSALAEVPLLEAALRAPEPARDPTPSRLLTAEEAAALLNIPVRWIRRHAKTLPHRKLGKYVRFEERALLRWAESRSRS